MRKGLPGSNGVRVKGQSKETRRQGSGSEFTNLLAECFGAEDQPRVGAVSDFGQHCNIQGFMSQFSPSVLPLVTVLAEAQLKRMR